MTKRARFPLIASALLALMLAPAAPAQPFGRLSNPNDLAALGDAVPFERFGASVAVDGSTAAVGSLEGRDNEGNAPGAVRVFVRESGAWRLQAKLLAPGGRSWDGFGSAIALEGDTLVVGASNYSREGFRAIGAAYVFVRHGATWTHVQTMYGPTPEFGYFGSAVALAGNEIAIGAPRIAVGGVEAAGSVYLYVRGADGWHAQDALGASVPTRWATFGSKLAFAGDELLVGAPGEDTGGAVYAFAHLADHWSLHQRLASAITLPGDGLGSALACDGTRLLAGAPARHANRTGSVLEWRRENGAWTEHGAIAIGGDATLRHFGIQLARRGERWLVGAEHRAELTQPVTADVYVYTSAGADLTASGHADFPAAGPPGWAVTALAATDDETFVGMPYGFGAPWSEAGEVRVLGASGAPATLDPGVTATYERFGNAVEATSDWLFVGAPGEHRHSTHAGAVFAYDRRTFDAATPEVITAPDGARNDGFGTSLALSGNTLLVGAAEDDQMGSVRLYERDGAQWRPVARWSAPDGGYRFGDALAADARAAISAALAVPVAPDRWRDVAYISERTTSGWTGPVPLVAPDAATDDLIGSVAIDGTTAVVGVLRFALGDFEQPLALDRAARIYERTASGWVQTARIERPAPADADGQFGAAVAIDGDTVFVGAPRAGAVFAFRRLSGQWKFVQRIDVATDTPYPFQRLRVFAHELWVATPGDVGGGKVRRYRATGGAWRLVQTILPDAPDRHGWLGAAFAVDADAVFVGDPGATGYAPFVSAAGAVRIEEAMLSGDGFE